MQSLIKNSKKISRKLINVAFPTRTKKENFDKIVFDKALLVNLTSNDYLGLSKNVKLIESSQNWTGKWGTGLSSSRLVSGNLEQIKDIEKKISLLVKKSRTLIMGSGFQTNATIIPTIIDNYLGSKKKAYIFSDKLNHASINLGCSISKQKTFRYRHLDLNHLEFFLKKTNLDNTKLIISETLFSMDGDCVDIESLRFLAKRYNCILYLDEAHAMGVYGKNGFGISSNKQNANEIIVGTFSKGFGSFGSFVSCSKMMYDKIVNYCGGIIYTTVLPPSVLGSISAAVKIVPQKTNLRNKLLTNSKFLINGLKNLSINVGDSNSHIIPIILKSKNDCEKLRDFLKKENFFTKVVSSPTVPLGTDRIRISLTATISKKVIYKLLELIKQFKDHEV